MAKTMGVIATVGAVAIGITLSFFIAWIIGNSLVISQVANSLNPAQSLGQNTLSNHPQFAVVFLLIPIVGIAVLGVIMMSIFK